MTATWNSCIINYMYTSIDKLIKYALICLNLIIIWGAFVYRVFSLGIIGIISVLILAFLSFFIILYIFNKFNQETIDLKIKKINEINQKKYAISDYALPFLYIILMLCCTHFLYSSGTTDAIISPWQKVPNYFFAAFFFASLCLATIILRNKPLAKTLIFLHYLLIFSIALFIYKIGYGFDPFIHQATEKLISQTGAVEPKPFYYLGQYALITIINKLSAIPIVWLDKLLVPILAALTLPTALFLTLTKWLENKTIMLLTIFLLPILPFSFFIVTTPQNLAYLFLILVLIFGLHAKNRLDLLNIILLSLSAFAVHPLAGIPTILFALLLLVYYAGKQQFKNNYYRIIFLLMAIALPLAFLFIQQNTGINVTDSASSVSSAINWPEIIIPDKENAILNTIYLFIFNFKLLFSLLAISGLTIILKNKKECKVLFLYLFSSLAMFISYLISSRLSFGFLIEYERSDYNNRILLIAAIFLVPLALLAIHAFLLKLMKQNKIIISIFIVFFSFLLTTSLYASYPRFDNYHNSHGYSVSKNDILAVEWINNDAKGDFIVLSNQQVSAASLKTFGFKKYYKEKGDNPEDIFYYPIPTGGHLYQLYLDMVYKKPARSTVLSALDLTGAKTGYFVLNKYWWAFPKIAAETKLEADSWQEIGEGEVFIFKYRLVN